MKLFLRSFYKLPDKLKRVTSGGSLIKEIDGLRFLAIFPVVIQHLNERIIKYGEWDFSSSSGMGLVSDYLNRGFIGVYIFFVISGFVLALPFASHYLKNSRKIELKKYYWRRVTRLEPPYIISMSIIFLILLLFVDGYGKELFPRYLSGIFYIQNLTYHTHNPVNPPTWTLEIEIQFYLMAPFLCMIFFSISKKLIRRLLMAGFILGVIILQNLSGIMHSWLVLTILAQIQFFLLGFLLADIYLVDWNKDTRNYRIFDYLAVLAFSGLLYIWNWDFNFTSRITFVILVFILFISVFRGVTVNKIFKNRWIMAIGGMCYTIYLIHLPFAELFTKIFMQLITFPSYLVNIVVLSLLFIPLLFVLSVGFYLSVEKPCMDKEWPGKLATSIKKIFKRQRVKGAVNEYTS